jgi:acyl-coenzyme A synthetase/AMP-(fatty) acid ligase
MIVDRIYDWAHTQPTKFALIHNDEVLTYSQFARAIARMRLFFEQQDLPVGQTAIVLINNLRDAWLSILSLRTLGLNTIVVKSIDSAESLKIRDVACIVVTQSERSHHKLAGHALAGAKVVAIPAEAYVVSKIIPTRDLNSSEVNGHILYTSGSTGANKKLHLDGVSEDDRNSERARFQRFSGDTVYYGAGFPLSTAMGFKCPSAVWHAGGCVVLHQASDGYAQLSRHKVTCAGVSVPILKDFLRTSAASDMPPLQSELTIGGGALPAGLARMAAEKLTPKVSNYYAATEFGTPMMHAEFGADGNVDWMAPADGVTAQIVDEHGNQCPVDREGHLRFQLREIDCSAYLDDAEASARVFRDGFFYPGDLAIRRSDGKIRVLGRNSDVIIIAGDKYASAPIEQAIQQRLGIHEVCVFTRMTEDGDDELAVCIQADRQPSEAEIAWLRGQIGRVKNIRVSVFETFPRTAAGMSKIDRATLKTRAFSESG